MTREELQRLGEILAGFPTTEAEDERLLQGAILLQTLFSVQTFASMSVASRRETAALHSSNIIAVHGKSGTGHPESLQLLF